MCAKLSALYAKQIMTAGEIILALVLQVILITLNAIFASAEIAVISSNSTKMEKLAEKPLCEYSFEEFDALWKLAKK